VPLLQIWGILKKCKAVSRIVTTLSLPNAIVWGAGSPPEPVMDEHLRVLGRSMRLYNSTRVEKYTSFGIKIPDVPARTLETILKALDGNVLSLQPQT